MLTPFPVSVMPVIDLHSHSHYSDGSLAPSALCRLAADKGVEVLALTDHDSVRGIAEAEAAAGECGLRLIPGVEVSALWGKTLVHVLGLNINPRDPALLAALEHQAGARGRRARLIADRLLDLGKGDSWPFVMAATEGDADRVGRTHFARYLVEAGHARTLQQAFTRLLGDGKPASVPIPWVPMPTAIGWIRASGGVAVLAHPSRYGISQTKLRALLQEFRETGGQGMEVASGAERPNVVSQMAQLAGRFDLLASQGSDYHGAHMPWLKLGEFAPLPSGCRPVWELF
jgi:predicted metal-dependent phosphoesterase TrpH